MYVGDDPSAVNVTVTLPLPAEPVGVVRAPPGIAAAVATDGKVVVLAPLGVTMKVYDVPLVSPVTVQFSKVPLADAGELTNWQVKFPGVDVTV